MKKHKKYTNNSLDLEIIVTTDTIQDFEGQLIITDPCYYINNNVWQLLCEEVFFNGTESTEFTKAGTIYIGSAKILYSSTAYGDGEFEVEDCMGVTQKTFGVDSGVMAVITKSDYERISYKELDKRLFALVEDFDGTVTATKEGNFRGDLTVCTDGTNIDLFDTQEEPAIDEFESSNDGWDEYGDDHDHDDNY